MPVQIVILPSYADQRGGYAEEPATHHVRRATPRRGRAGRWRPQKALTRRSKGGDPATPEEIDATLQGRLMMVDWKRRTAKLHRYGQPSVRLRFDAALDDEMQRLARKYVEVKGRGRTDQDGNWANVHVEHVTETPSWSEPFDLDRLLNAPLKIFDPEKVVRASDPIDVDQFMRTIREGRDA